MHQLVQYTRASVIVQNDTKIDEEKSFPTMANPREMPRESVRTKVNAKIKLRNFISLRTAAYFIENAVHEEQQYFPIIRFIFKVEILNSAHIKAARKGRKNGNKRVRAFLKRKRVDGESRSRSKKRCSIPKSDLNVSLTGNL
jgi:hypothetical protein